MRIVVISPEGRDAREIPAIGGFLEAGLTRYHVRKPAWSRDELEAWLLALPSAWRPALVLHQHHDLVDALGLGGQHVRDTEGSAPGLSRSCHDVASLGRHMSLYPQVIFGPVFPSLSKPGHGPSKEFPWASLREVLTGRRDIACEVLAIGGITRRRLGRVAELGFDGAAVLGAVWNAIDPVLAFAAINETASSLEAAHHAA